MLSLLRVGFFYTAETRADLRCAGKEPSESDKWIIDVIGVIRMSMQSFTKLVGIGSKSDYLQWSPQNKTVHLIGNDTSYALHDLPGIGRIRYSLV